HISHANVESGGPRGLGEAHHVDIQYAFGGRGRNSATIRRSGPGHPRTIGSPTGEGRVLVRSSPFSSGHITESEGLVPLLPKPFLPALNTWQGKPGALLSPRPDRAFRSRPPIRPAPATASRPWHAP